MWLFIFLINALKKKNIDKARDIFDSMEIYVGLTVRHRKDKPGTIVTKVCSGSPGEEAGVKIGDIITHMNSKMMENRNCFFDTYKSLKPGDTVPIIVARWKKCSHDENVKNDKLLVSPKLLPIGAKNYTVKKIK